MSKSNNKKKFSVGSYKFIYFFSLVDPITGQSSGANEGLVKIGDSTVHVPQGKTVFDLTRADLMESAELRVDNIMGTSRIPYKIHHVELAIHTRELREGDDPSNRPNIGGDYEGYTYKRSPKGNLLTFRDYAFSRYLKRNGYNSVDPSRRNDKTSEWYDVPLERAIELLNSFRKGKPAPAEDSAEDVEIELREEQLAALELTLEKFPKNPRKGTNYKVLWNAKPRFGKTTTSCALIEKMTTLGYAMERVLVTTHRPDVLDSWQKDFDKSKLDSLGWVFASKEDGSFEEVSAQAKLDKNKLVYFVSIQDIRGSYTGNVENPDFTKLKKNKEIFETNFDLIITDEVHEGTLTGLAKSMMRELKSNYYLDLSGTPFNILQADTWDDQELALRFTYDGVYSWSYVDERRAKIAWDNDPEKLDHRNPYAELPEVVFVHYNIDDILKTVNPNDAFGNVVYDLGAFFATTEKRDAFNQPLGARFVNENEVLKFLTRLCGDRERTNDPSVFPYSLENEGDFEHTLWMLPSVGACEAMQYLLENVRYAGFKDYKIINATGKGNSVSDDKAAINRVLEATEGEKPTITLSYRMLTTGVTVPAWTAVLMMNNNSSPMSYLQTVFRAATPGVLRDGRVKETAYVLDFNPNRCLTMVMEYAKNCAKTKNRGNTPKGDGIDESLPFNDVLASAGEEELSHDIHESLKVLNVFSATEGTMVRQDTDVIMAKLNEIYVNEIVAKNFNSPLLWNRMALDNIDVMSARLMNKINDLDGSKKASKNKIVMSETTPEVMDRMKSLDKQAAAHKKGVEAQKAAKKREQEARRRAEKEAKAMESKAKESGETLPDHETLVGNLMTNILGADHRVPDDSEIPPALTTEEKTEAAKIRSAAARDRKNRENVENILASVAARLAMLVFAIGKSDQITAENFIDYFDDESWAEFMLKNVKRVMPEGTPPLKERLDDDSSVLYWDDIVSLFNADFFWRAVERVRSMTDNIMAKPVLERSFRLMMIFTTFMNPDKETVLTPARVVTMQYADTFGCLSFFDLDSSDARSWMTYMRNLETGEQEIHESRDALALLNAGSHTVDPQWVESKLVKRSLAREGVRTDGKSMPELLDGFWERDDLSFYDINSKTALYPLLAATTQWFARIESYSRWLDDDVRPLLDAGVTEHEFYNGPVEFARNRVNENAREREETLWGDIVRNTIFLNSRVAYSKRLAIRVLAGYDEDLAADVAKNSTVVDVVALMGALKSYEKSPKLKKLFKKFKGRHEFASMILRLMNRGFVEVHAPAIHKKMIEAGVSVSVEGDHYELIARNLDIILTTPITSEENQNSMNQLIAIVETYKDELPKFVALIGNPPYTIPNENDAGATSIYPEFFDISYHIAKFASIVSPARWFNSPDYATKAGRAVIRELGIEHKFPLMVKYDESGYVFDNVSVKGGISWWLYSEDYEGKTEFIHDGMEEGRSRDLLSSDGVIDIEASLARIKELLNESLMCEIENPVIDMKNNLLKVFKSAYGKESTDTIVKHSTVDCNSHDDVRLHISGGNGWRYVPNELFSDKSRVPNGKFAMVFAHASSNGRVALNDKSMILKENESAQATMAIYLDKLEQVVNLYKFARTKFFRVLVESRLSSHHTYPQAYKIVPWIFNFDESDPIDWSQSVENIDAQLVKFFGLEEWNDFIQAVEWPFANYFADEFVDRLIEYGYDPDEVHYWYGRVVDEKYNKELSKQKRLDKKNAK